MASASFRLDRVGVGFDGAEVLREVDLEIAPGEQVALVGPSGAGKTTLLRVLDGVLRPCSGRMLWDGQDVYGFVGRKLRAFRADVGFVPQDHGLVPNLRVVQNVVSGKLGRRGFLASLRSLLWPSRDDLLRAHEVLEQVGIADYLFHRTDRLSGGQQQRVAIVRALFQDPEALLADEPVASVDPPRARSIIRLLTGLAADRGLTLVVSLHDLDLARAFLPRVVGLRDGRILFDQPADRVTSTDVEALYAFSDVDVDVES